MSHSANKKILFQLIASFVPVDNFETSSGQSFDPSTPIGDVARQINNYFTISPVVTYAITDGDARVQVSSDASVGDVIILDDNGTPPTLATWENNLLWTNEQLEASIVPGSEVDDEEMGDEIPQEEEPDHAPVTGSPNPISGNDTGPASEAQSAPDSAIGDQPA